MDEQFEFLALVTRRLDALDIPYMLSGSVALSLYAEPRMTRDIDFVIDIQTDKVRGFVNAFSGDCYVEETAVRAAVQRRDMFNIIHTEWVLKADFVVRKDAAFRIEEFGRRRSFDSFDFPVMVVTPEDLLLSKLVWAKEGMSELQERDVANLLRSQPNLDWDYIQKWAGYLDVLDILQRLRNGDR